MFSLGAGVLSKQNAVSDLYVERHQFAVFEHLAMTYSNDFTLLRQHPFRGEDLRGVHLGGQTGGPQAALEARITDFRIRAEALPGRIAQ